MRQTALPFPCRPRRVNLSLALGVLALLILVAAALWALTSRRWQNRRTAALQRLLDLADRLEADLKRCRAGLAQAHAVMAINPDAPAASEHDAKHAVDAGLQALLRQRIWIRDHAAQASQHALDEAAAAMQASRERLQPLLAALDAAQHDLDSAMREHIHRDAE